jgi:glycosyltransferase involved in cell wall biosynthesis
MNIPKVSIVIPYYNAVKYIEETIDSVVKQTYNNWECIILNDGSPDDGETIILNKIKNDARFYYYAQLNTGVCEARNNAMKHAKGEYILFLDADDLISPNFLEETVKVLDENVTVSVVTSIVKLFGGRKKVLQITSYDLPTIIGDNKIVVTSLFRKTDFDAVGGFNLNMKDGYEDWDFWIGILKRGGKVVCAEKATFYYRYLQKSRNNTIDIEKEQKLRKQMWENHKEVFSQYYIDPTLYFEYKRYAESIEYRIGKLIIAPIKIVALPVLVFINKITTKYIS